MDDYLVHHGVKGQKWGVRRFQNKDGSRTSLGKKRMSLDNKKTVVEGGRRIVDESRNINRTIAGMRKKKSVDLSKMTDEELRKRINRMNLEQQYSNLTSSTSKGHAYVDNTLAIAGSALAVTSSALTIALTIKQLKGK